jgi:hypothetical protein
MDKISLSIEELIYCFYSEGFFEQGNALKQAYFEELNDEKMDLLLQIATRSLLSKDLVSYKDHKFTIVERLTKIISILNHSEQSIKVSRHDGSGGEEAFSFHFTGDTFVKHSLYFDQQVHVFSTVNLEEVITTISDFYRIGNDEDVSNQELSLSKLEFEEMIDSVNSNKIMFESPSIQGAKKQFFQSLLETRGLLNTLLFFEFNDKGEPEVKSLILFTNMPERNWNIENIGEVFYVKASNRDVIKNLVTKNIQNSEEKETVNYGK